MEIHYKHSQAVDMIGDYLVDQLDRETAIVCIGTDKCIVDAVGPLVGTMLKKNNIVLDIYGTLNNPVHALNLGEMSKKLTSQYENIIAIDACLSNKKNVGIIECRQGPLTPGKGIGKYLPEIGNCSIIAIVDNSNKDFHELVQDTRLSLIYDMAEIIAEGITLAIEKMNSNYESEFEAALAERGGGK